VGGPRKGDTKGGNPGGGEAAQVLLPWSCSLNWSSAIEAMLYTGKGKNIRPDLNIMSDISGQKMTGKDQIKDEKDRTK
jgi:hypothetical protein